jgi:poly-gamma-glutamate synthesis protein (capsule biosynthesis protein)
LSGGGGRTSRQALHRRRRLLAALALAAALALIVGVAIGGSGGSDEDAAGGGSAAATEPVRFSVAATGDFLIHSLVFERALEYGDGKRYDFRPMFREIRPYIEDADLGVCHVETPMTSAEPIGYPVFNTPPDLARDIAVTGWDVCSTASNHSLDQGQDGIAETTRALDRAGVGHTGSYASRAESRDPLIVDVEGVPVALLSYTEMTNGIPLPKPWSVNVAKADTILADARAAREAGAQVVIVNLHAGEEFVAEPSEFQTELARKLTASDDVSAVIGQHAHIVQPIERVKGKPVVYGEGNLVSNQDALCCPEASQDGLIAVLDFVVEDGEARVEAVRYVPIYVSRPDYTVLPVGDALESGEDDAAALRASYERTVDVVGREPWLRPEPPRLP